MYSRVGNIAQTVDRGVILHQVNCQGVMGSGVAAALRAAYPVIYDKYRELWEDCIDASGNTAALLGRAQLVRVNDRLWVCNLFGQQYYGKDGKRYTSYDAVDTGLQALAKLLPTNGLQPSDVHHPLLGSGLGGAHWPAVKGIIEHRLGDETTLWTLPT